MKLHIEQPALAHALKRVGKLAINSNTNTDRIAITADAEAQTLTLRTTDLITEMTATIPAEVNEGGSMLLPAKTMPEWVNRAPESKIQIVVNGKDAVLKSGRTRATLHPIVGELPSLEAHGEAVATWTTPEKFWMPLTRRHLAVVARDETRPILRGVALTLAEKTATLASTDGSRLARTRVPLETSLSEAKTVVIPAPFMHQLADISEPITFTSYERELKATWEGGSLTTRLLEGEYPPVDRVFPSEYVSEFTINTAEIIGAFQRMSLLASKDRTPSVTISIEPGKLQLQAKAAEIGQGEEVWEVTATGQSLEMLFNPDFLLDILRTIRSETVHIEFAGETAPARFTDTSDPNAEVIALPLRKLA